MQPLVETASPSQAVMGKGLSYYDVLGVARWVA